MVQKPRWLSLATAGIVAMMVFAACTPTGPAAPTGTPRAATPAAPTGTPAAPGTPVAPETPEGTPVETPEGTPVESPTTAPLGTPYPEPEAQPGAPAEITDAYPNYGEVDCENATFNGLPYAGQIQSITAPDPDTVVFTLCKPDVAFLAKVAFTVFAINDKDWLIENTPEGCGGEGNPCPTVSEMNGTGPLRFEEWRRGAEVVYSRFDEYWGDPAAAADVVLRWGTEPATRLQELQAGTVHGIAQVGPTDFETVRGDSTLQLLDASGLNTLYVGMNHNFEPWSNPQVRQALAIGIDRQRIVDNFLPPPPASEVASHFTPCEIEFACGGDPWPDYDPDEARRLIDEATSGAGIDTTLAWRNPPARIYMPLPDETATDLQAQLADIGIRVSLDKQESGTFIGNSNAGRLEGLFLLGWGADYPDVTNFLDFHFGEGCTSAFGACYPEIYEHLNIGNSTPVAAEREAAYTDANNAIREQVPMVPVSHAGFANAYRAGVEGAHISPLSNELLFRMAPPEGDQFVFMQAAEPIGLYCADETDGESLRACEQTMEALYSYEQGGTEAIPALADECTPNDDLTVWTCNLRDGVTFHDGATFEAQDVITSFAAQWDVLSPLHAGNTSQFEYWGGLWGGNLNPPAPCGIEGQPAC